VITNGEIQVIEYYMNYHANTTLDICMLVPTERHYFYLDYLADRLMDLPGFRIEKAQLSAKALPHFNLVVLVDTGLELGLLKEFKMIPASYNGKTNQGIDYVLTRETSFEWL
jgi:hypothetical protein